MRYQPHKNAIKLTVLTKLRCYERIPKIRNVIDPNLKLQNVNLEVVKDKKKIITI